MADIQKLNVNSTTYDISVPWGKVTGKPSTFPADAHSHQSILPTRHDTIAPTPKDKYGLTFQFSYNIGCGADWWNVLNMRSYSDNNYLSAQIATPAGNPGADTGYIGNMCWRSGRNSTWSNWKIIVDSSNISSYALTSLPSHTHTKSQITDFPSSMPASDVYSWAKAASKPSYTYSEVGAAPASHSHNYLTIGTATPSTAYSDGNLKSFILYSTANGSAGYAGDNSGFPVSNNANGILWMGNHGGKYGGQLGISSNGYLYYRFITAGGFPSTANGGSWNRIAWGSEIPSLSGYATQTWVNNKGYITGITKSMVTTALGYTPPTSDTNSWRPVTNTYTGSDQSTCVSQYGTNALYNALVNGYANSSGYADSAGSVVWSGVTGKPVLPVYYNLYGSDAYSILKNNATSFARNQLVHAYLGHGSASFAMGWVLSGYDSGPYCAFIVNGYGDNWSLVGSSSGSWTHRTLLHSGNISSYALTSLPSHTHDYAASNHTHTSFANSITVTGSVSASSGFYQSSDERLKTFHDPIKVDLDKLKTLRKNYFKFNDKDKLEIGVSAQEIQNLYPEIVTNDDEGYLSVAYDKLSVIALKAVDELNDINDKQQKEIDDLKDQLSTIKNILKEKGIL